METPTVAANKKKAARLGAHLVFADESGFLLLPHVAKTWAPVGQTPIHRHVYRRDKISVKWVCSSATCFGISTVP
jgi:hypothetical protein